MSISHDVWGEPRDAPTMRYRSVGPRWLVILVLGGVAVAGLLGAAARRFPGLERFDLDAEWTVSSLFAALLFASAGAALVSLSTRLRLGWAAIALGALTVVAAIDEMAQVHERLSASLEISWQRLYLPAFTVAGVAWIVLVTALRRYRPAQVMFVFGGVAWAVSQMLERLQWDGDVAVSNYGKIMVAEEVLEMTGSALILFAALHVRRATSPSRLEPAPPS